MLSGDDEGWKTVTRRRKKSDEQLAQEFWTDIGYPTPASRFWEKGTPSGSSRAGTSCSFGCRSSVVGGRTVASAVTDAERRRSADPTPAVRGVRIGRWHGPLPRPRITPPAVLGDFMDACDRAVLTSDGEDVGPPVVAGHAAAEATQIVATAGNGPESCMPTAGSRIPQSPGVGGADESFRNSITMSVGLPVHDDLGRPLCQTARSFSTVGCVRYPWTLIVETLFPFDRSRRLS